MGILEIYKETIGFAVRKCLLGLATVLVSFLVYLGLYGLFRKCFGDHFLLLLLAILVWLAVAVVATLKSYELFGYKIKAGHMAVVLMGITEDRLPTDQKEIAKNVVSKRFLNFRIYYLVERMIGEAIGDLQNDRFYSFLLPCYADCCQAFTYCGTQASVYHSALDGLVICHLNWDELTEGQSRALMQILVTTGFLILAPALILGLIFGIMGWHALPAVILGVMIGVVLKKAFVDSYYMIAAMIPYLFAVMDTEFDYSIYGKIAERSKGFLKLGRKARVL